MCGCFVMVDLKINVRMRRGDATFVHLSTRCKKLRKSNPYFIDGVRCGENVIILMYKHRNYN